MRLLLVEKQPGSARALGEHLTQADHEVVSCCEDGAHSPCRNVQSGDDCPLDGHVDLAIMARSEELPRTLFEMGGVCAQRRHIPVAQINPSECTDAETTERLVSEALAVATAASEDAYCAQVRAALSMPDLDVVASRSTGRIHLVLHLAGPRDAQADAALGDKARAAIRKFDPEIPVIDVSVAG